MGKGLMGGAEKIILTVVIIYRILMAGPGALPCHFMSFH